MAASRDPRADPAGTESAWPRGQRWWGSGALIAAAAVGVLLWLAGHVLLIVFAGILFAVALDGLAEAISRKTGLARGWAMLAVIMAFGTVLLTGGLVAAPQFAEQLDQLWQRLTEVSKQIREMLRGYGLGRSLLGSDEEDSAAREVAGEIANIAMTTISGMINLVIIIVIGMFMAVNPGLYRSGVLRLVPAPYRDRADEVMSALGHALRWWLLGQLVSMTTLLVVTSTGLYLLGVPLWLALGVLTGALTFIPFLGPIIAAVPVALVAFAQGLDVAIYTMLLFLAIQNFEGYWLTPMVQQHAVRLPPALLISMQVMLGTLFGTLGLVLAAPLTAVGMVAVSMIYVEDILGERHRN